MRNMNALEWISLILTIIGGINWGLVGAFNFDLVATLFGPMSTLSRIIYVLVGLAALYMLIPVIAKRESTPRMQTRTQP